MQTMNLPYKIITMALLITSVWGTMLAGRCRAQQLVFTIQVMSGTDKEAATRFAAELISKGFDASIAERAEKEKPVYKVRVGSFKSREAAAGVHETLRLKGIEGWITQVLEPPAPQTQHTETTVPAQLQHAEAAAPAPPPSLEPPAQQKQPDNGTEPSGEIFKLVINPVPTFSDDENKTAQPSATAPAPAPVCAPAKTYKYFNSGDKTIHITNAIEKVPVQYRRHIWEIAIFPIYFKSFNRRDMSMKTHIDGAATDVFLEGIAPPERAPSAAAVRDFEAALMAAPLRIKYYPARTDPDGTLHGALFFRDGLSVELDMILRGLAACEEGVPAGFQHKDCYETQQRSNDQLNTVAPPH